MCTLTYVPKPSGPIITANRDESPLRNASTLSEYTAKTGETFLIAKEPIHGGTNFAGSTNAEKVAVLLNGAFRRHEMGGKYRLSRGLVVLESLEWNDLFEFSRHFDFEGVEPFTLFHFDAGPREIRWNGRDLFRREYPVGSPMIVASAQLYLPLDQVKRQKWFGEVLNTPEIGPAGLFDFHLNGGDGNLETDMVMNRKNKVCTVSISQISTAQNKRFIRHFDLVDRIDRTSEFKR